MTDAPAPENPTAAGRSEVPFGPERRSLLAIYVMSLVTMGAYLVYWTHRTVRTTSPDPILRAHPVGTAVGSIATPVQAAVLYDLLRASFERRSAVDPARTALVAPVLSISIGALLLLGEWRVLLLPGLLLWPMPHLRVQASINRESAARRVEPSLSHWLVGIGAAIVGAAGLAGWVWTVDLPAARDLLAPTLEGGASVASESGRFGLRLPAGRWQRLAPGTLGDDDADLELQSEDGESWIIAYVEPSSETTLDSTVATRRQMIREESELTDYREVRSFAEGSDHVPMSIAEYTPAAGPLFQEKYVVYTAGLEDAVVEIISYSIGPPAKRSALRRVAETVTLQPREEAP
jgi:hypothetical protein